MKVEVTMQHGDTSPAFEITAETGLDRTFIDLFLTEKRINKREIKVFKTVTKLGAGVVSFGFRLENGEDKKSFHRRLTTRIQSWF